MLPVAALVKEVPDRLKEPPVVCIRPLLTKATGWIVSGPPVALMVPLLVMVLAATKLLKVLLAPPLITIPALMSSAVDVPRPAHTLVPEPRLMVPPALAVTVPRLSGVASVLVLVKKMVPLLPVLSVPPSVTLRSLTTLKPLPSVKPNVLWVASPKTTLENVGRLPVESVVPSEEIRLPFWMVTTLAWLSEPMLFSPPNRPAAPMSRVPLPRSIRPPVSLTVVPAPRMKLAFGKLAVLTVVDRSSSPALKLSWPLLVNPDVMVLVTPAVCRLMLPVAALVKEVPDRLKEPPVVCIRPLLTKATGWIVSGPPVALMVPLLVMVLAATKLLKVLLAPPLITIPALMSSAVDVPRPAHTLVPEPRLMVPPALAVTVPRLSGVASVLVLVKKMVPLLPVLSVPPSVTLRSLTTLKPLPSVKPNVLWMASPKTTLENVGRVLFAVTNEPSIETRLPFSTRSPSKLMPLEKLVVPPLLLMTAPLATVVVPPPPPEFGLKAMLSAPPPEVMDWLTVILLKAVRLSDAAALPLVMAALTVRLPACEPLLPVSMLTVVPAARALSITVLEMVELLPLAEKLGVSPSSEPAVAVIFTSKGSSSQVPARPAGALTFGVLPTSR